MLYRMLYHSTLGARLCAKSSPRQRWRGAAVYRPVTPYSNISTTEYRHTALHFPLSLLAIIHQTPAPSRWAKPAPKSPPVLTDCVSKLGTVQTVIPSS